MSRLVNMIYGLISGITEFLPVSSRAHQILLRYIFGADSRNFLQEFLVHIGLLAAIIVSCREILARLRQEQRTAPRHRKKGKYSLDRQSYYELRLLKTGTFPIIIGLFLSFATEKMGNSLLSVMAFLLVNAFVMFIAEHCQHGNRDARTMSALDGIVMGVLGGLSIFPGISRTGMISAYTTLRGADFKLVTNRAFLLGIPAIVLLICFDLFGLITVGVGAISFTIFLGYILSGIFAFVGGYIAISLFLMIINHAGFAQFAYYSVGAALFAFLLYLIT